jgi:hypothetical protein
MAATAYSGKICNTLKKKLHHDSVAGTSILKNKPLEKPAIPKGVGKSGKSPYSSPVLRIYGSVKDLTKGGAGSNADGFTGSKSYPPGRIP